MTVDNGYGLRGKRMQRIRKNNPKRRAAIAVITAMMGTVMLGFASLAVDVGMLYNVKAELQRTADSAAMAGAWEMLSQKYKGYSDDTAKSSARTQAIAFAARNHVYNTSPVLDGSSDVTIGYLSNPSILSQILDTGNAKFNTVSVWVHRDSTRNGPVDLFFGRIFGVDSSGVWAKASATFDEGTVTSWKVTSKTGNAGLLPLALHVDSWNQLISGTKTTGDNYRYDPATGNSVPGTDGINELNLYPGAGPTQLPPGNFGTVDLGSPNNSTADITRQILYGVNESDLSYFPNSELKLGPDGTVMINGDTGLSAGIKEELTLIKGLPRSIPIFDHVAGNGNNSMFRVVGFVPIRILNVTLTGEMNSKNVIIQPTLGYDPTATVDTTAAPTNHDYYTPVRLSR
jgi:Flp pilus assembly protein TadG